MGPPSARGHTSGTLPYYRGCWTHRALRYRAVHWRFRVLQDAYPTGSTLTEEAVWEWCIRVDRAICEILGTDNELHETMSEVRHRMAFGVDIEPRKRRREAELFGSIRAATRFALNGAAFVEQEKETVVRVVDLHPWIAEPAERLFDDGHRRQAILAAAQNLEKQWRTLLGVATPTLSQLAQESFSASAPTPEHPRLRYPTLGTDTNSPVWKNAHIGAMEYAKGCAMRIRNLNLHHPEDSEPTRDYTVESLSALSLLARWITEAEVQTDGSG